MLNATNNTMYHQEGQQHDREGVGAAAEDEHHQTEPGHLTDQAGETGDHRDATQHPGIDAQLRAGS